MNRITATTLRELWESLGELWERIVTTDLDPLMDKLFVVVVWIILLGFLVFIGTLIARLWYAVREELEKEE